MLVVLRPRLPPRPLRLLLPLLLHPLLSHLLLAAADCCWWLLLTAVGYCCLLDAACRLLPLTFAASDAAVSCTVTSLCFHPSLCFHHQRHVLLVASMPVLHQPLLPLLLLLLLPVGWLYTLRG